MPRTALLLGSSAEEVAEEAAFKMYYWDDPEKEHILRRLLEGRNQLANSSQLGHIAHVQHIPAHIANIE